MDKDLELAAINPAAFLSKPQTKHDWDMSIEDVARVTSYRPIDVLLTKSEQNPEAYGWFKTAMTNVGRGVESFFNAETGTNALVELYTSPNMKKEKADRMIEDIIYSRLAGRQAEALAMPVEEQLGSQKYPKTANFSQAIGQWIATTAIGIENPAAAWSTLYASAQGQMEEGLADKYLKQHGSMEGYAEKKRQDDLLIGAYATINTLIERGLGTERIVERAFHNPTRAGLKSAVEQIINPSRWLTKQALKQAGKQTAKGFLGEGTEEFTQEYLGSATEVAAGYKQISDLFSREQLKKALSAGVTGGILGAAAGFGLHSVNRAVIKREVSQWAKEKGINLSDAQLTQVANDLIDTTQDTIVDELSSISELQNKYGQSYDKIKTDIKNALELQGWNEKMVDQKTGKPLSIDEYVDLTVNSQLINTAIKESFNSGISIDEFLDVAQFVGIDNFMTLRPLGTAEQIQARIDEQNAIIKRQTELKKTGAGDATALSEARMKKAILQKVKLNKLVNEEIQKVNVEEAKTPEIKQEIENATNDVDTLTKSDTASDFNAELDNKSTDGQTLTTDQKIKRLGNAVIKKIFGSDKLGFDSVMTLPEYTNARIAITNSADRIFNFAKKHRKYGIYTDLRNALKAMSTVNQGNFLEHATTPNLDGNDVVAENAFLYHFLFSDSNTISAFIDAYLERAEASIAGETLNLSKKDLVGQAFKATDNLMQIQAESAGVEYNSIYNEDGSYKDQNVAAVMMSYQNQFVQEPTQLTLFQPEQFDLADENARLDDIYPEYTGETIEVDGKERTVYNSNGDRIAKSKEALTNFWQWFGDSKVVDSQGRPLVVYHGTNTEFDTFDIEKSKEGVFGEGFYFAPDTKLPEKIGKIVMPVYLKIENPIYSEEKVRTSWGGFKPKRTIVQIRELVKKPKYDGIIGMTEFYVKTNTQIKSVDNRGTYSSDTGNIYYQGKQANGFYDPELNVVLLGKNWNTMTLPHEFAHYWLNTLFNVYKRVQAGELQASADWIAEKKDMFAMLGINENQQALTVGQQEKFARMTEAYLTGIGIGKETNQTFKDYFAWVPEKYKSILQLGYLDDQGKIQYPFLDQKAVDFFNRWYENASLPSLPTSPERQRFMNATDENGDVQKVSIKEMNDREKEFAQDAEEQYRTDQRLYNTLDENMPANIKPAADAQKVAISERSNFLKESQAEQNKVSEEPKRRWFERKSRETETQLAQEYIEKNPEHAKEVIFGDPEFVANDTGVDRATLINTYMAMNNITPNKPEWATLHTNIAINQSLAGTQLALSNDKSYGTYLDALREIENVLEMKAATNYASSKTGALERFNADIQRFLYRELPSIFATEPNSKERETALRMMFEKARTTFSGNTTGTFLNQMDLSYAISQKRKSEAFMRWATNQIKKDVGAKLNNEQQAKLLEVSAKAQQALVDLDSQDTPTAVAAAQELRKWQLEKQKLMGISPQKFSLMGDWAPRAMLASFNTLVVANVPSTAINTAVTNLTKTGLFGKNKVSKNLIDGEIKRIKAIYGATAMNLAQMEKPTSPSLLHGEKYSASGQRWYDPYTILGKEDNFFRVPTFVNTLAQIASKDAEATGRNADDVFKEYLSLNNQSDEAKLARKQALAVSNMAVFTQNGALASCLNHIRSELNKLSRVTLGLDPQGFGLGNLIAPFLTTGANIAEMGIRGSLAPITTITTMVNKWRTGKALDPMKKLALRMDWTYFTLSAVSMVLLSALTSDDDDFYTDPYRTGRKYDPNKPYDSINIAGVWLDLDFFGPFSIPMRTAAKVIQAWKKDNGIVESIAKGYGESAKEVLGDIPLVESIVNNQFNWAVRKPGAWASSYLYTQANKLVPAQIKPISRVISRSQDWIFEPGGTVGRKFNRNYGFDGIELTTQDLIEMFTIKLQLDERLNQKL